MQTTEKWKIKIGEYRTSLTIIADYSSAAAPILYLGDNGDEFGTPFQVADARHCPRRALALVLEHLESACGFLAGADAAATADAASR